MVNYGKKTLVYVPKPAAYKASQMRVQETSRGSFYGGEIQLTFLYNFRVPPPSFGFHRELNPTDDGGYLS